jgi:magnesium transporter
LVVRKGERPVIRVMSYTPERLHEQQVADVPQIADLLRPGTVTWIDVQGLGDEKLLRALADAFQIHPLALEDVVNVPQRPKVEEYEEHLLLITRMIMLRRGHEVQREQVSMFVGRDYVLTIQERYGDVFDRVRARIRQGGPVFRSSGSEYLAYALLDATIDGYYPVLESYGEELETLENEIVATPHAASMRRLFRIRRDLLAIRRAIWPLREVVGALLREDVPFLTDKVRYHLRDCHDHCVQIVDVVESYRELAGGLMDVYLSSVGNRQNEVMKTLTIMASIFIPLTFMAGIYGMNFENMPELHARWGYPILLAAMLAVAATMSVYFYWLGWFGRKRSADMKARSESD